MSSEHPTVAVDLGGTHVRAALVAPDGTVLTRVRRQTPVDDPTPGVLAEIVSEVLDGRTSSDVRGAVIGVPGVVDHDNEILLTGANLPPAWMPSLTGASLGAAMGLPVSLGNDADLAAVGEAFFGAGRDARDVVFVTMSTGVGAGIVLGRRLVRGRYSGAEIGHTIIDRRALAAGDPHSTVETLGSGTALARSSAAIGLDLSGADLADRVRSGDPEATAVWNSGVEAAAIGIVNLCWLVGPQLVAIGGGVGMNGDLVLPLVRQLVLEHGPGVAATKVVNAELGDDAALSGAAAWVEANGPV